jgi:hypothetical protein
LDTSSTIRPQLVAQITLWARVSERIGVHGVGTEPREVRNLSGATATVFATLGAPNADEDIFRAEDPARACS